MLVAARRSEVLTEMEMFRVAVPPAGDDSARTLT